MWVGACMHMCGQVWLIVASALYHTTILKLRVQTVRKQGASWPGFLKHTHSIPLCARGYVTTRGDEFCSGLPGVDSTLIFFVSEVICILGQEDGGGGAWVRLVWCQQLPSLHLHRDCTATFPTCVHPLHPFSSFCSLAHHVPCELALLKARAQQHTVTAVTQHACILCGFNASTHPAHVVPQQPGVARSSWLLNQQRCSCVSLG